MQKKIFKKKRFGLAAIVIIIVAGIGLASLELAKHVPSGLAKTQQQQVQKN
jgi:hypothetical protein